MPCRLSLSAQIRMSLLYLSPYRSICPTLPLDVPLLLVWLSFLCDIKWSSAW